MVYSNFLVSAHLIPLSPQAVTFVMNSIRPDKLDLRSKVRTRHSSHEKILSYLC